MTLKLITLLFLTTSTIAFSQGNSTSKDVKIKVISFDTIKAKNNDTISIGKGDINERELRIVVENSPQGNYFKDVLPILTLLLGIGINKFLDYLKDKKRLKKIGERWKAELASLEMPISKQINYLEEFLIEQKKEVFDVPKLNIVTPLDCEIFSSLDKSDFIKFIQSDLSKSYKDSVLLSSRINSFITILKNNYSNIKSKFNEYLEGISAYTTKLTSGLQELMIEFADFGVKIEREVKGDPTQDPNYKAMLDLFDKEITPKLSTGDYDVYELENKFFLPLFSILSIMRLDDRTKKMADIASNCISIIKGMKMEKKYLSENITILISHFNDDAKDLAEIESALQ